MVSNSIARRSHTSASCICIPMKREHEKARVDLIAIENGHIAANSLVIAARLDFGMQGVALSAELRDRYVKMSTVVGLQQAIESDPAHDLGMCVVTTAAAAFPDPVIGCAPPRADRSAQFDEVALRRAIERPSTREPDERGFDKLAICVQLKLLRSEVACPNRTRASISGKMRQLPLRKMRFAIEVVRHIDVRPRQMRRMQQPREKCVRLHFEAEIAERAKRQ